MRNQKKVVIINGSPRKNGVTATALHMIEAELQRKGVEVFFYNLSEIDMHHCIGCCSCYTKGRCFMDDDAEKISRLIEEVDGIVLGSPTYASNISGIMKTFIDRGHFVIEQLLRGKFCVTVATGENYGYRDTLKVLNNLVSYSGGINCNTLLIKTAFNDIDSVSESMVRKCHKAVENLLDGINGKKKFALQKLICFVIFEFGIRPFVKRKGAVYQGVIEKWQRNGTLGQMKRKI